MLVRTVAPAAVFALVLALLPAPGPAIAAPAAADFSSTPPVPLVGEAVTFTATASPGTGATIASYRWDLDGNGSFELNTGLVPAATTTYSSERTLTVSMQMRDSLDNRVTATHVVTVGGQPPVASFTVAPLSPLVNQPVTFTSTSSDPGGSLIELAWDLDGNGVFDNGSGPVAMRVFPARGVYVVGLRATDNERHSAFSTQTVTVAAPLRLLSPFPVVRISGALTAKGARLRLVAISAPPGATVRVRCAGRGCPFRSKLRTISSAGTRLRVAELEKALPAGVRIRIYVSSPDTIGKYTVFTIRRGRGPRREDSCVVHGSSRPVACPAG